jgi:O-antigen ligase
MALALLGAFTRGIWLGTLAGATFLVGSYRRWMMGLIPSAVLLLYLLSPSWLQRRDESIFEPEQDSSSMARLVMIRTGVNMIAAHPVFGLGPERVGPEFDRYKPEGITLPPAWYGHLHDTYLQIAAERGIPCLIILLWLLFNVFRDNLPRTRSPALKACVLSYAAIAATIGLMVSGLFEYNIGDSEVFMLYLFVISIPYAWARLESSPMRPAQGVASLGAIPNPS